GRLVPCDGSSSFSSRFLSWFFQMSFVKYPEREEVLGDKLKILQKASSWVGFVVPVDAIISKVSPTQSPTRPRLLARKRRGRLTRLLLSVVPMRIQNLLGYLPADWGRSNMPKEIREALISPHHKANKRKWDELSLEEQESWLVVLERDLPEDDSEDVTYEPSDTETDSEEYKSHNDTDADLEPEEQDGTIMLKECSDLQCEEVKRRDVPQATQGGCSLAQFGVGPCEEQPDR
ncbi:PREDICTED: uncharacterized protein LOC104467091, partial [Pterocles gutturalis]|uniref:uncharacterized protein LOC104467091 n=1 Tax=Pterocles gutturalis TaxID=240206 RepID=UPI000528613A